MNEKPKNPYQATEIDGKWYVTGDGVKLPVKDKEYAETLARVLFNIDIPAAPFFPGRKKKSV